MTVEHAESELSERERLFVGEAVAALRGTGHTPAEVFDGGLDGLADTYGITEPDRVEKIRKAVYERTNHLDVSELGE